MDIDDFGVIINRSSGLYVKFTEDVEIKYCVDWSDASIVPLPIWENDDHRSAFIEFHELADIEMSLDFVPFSKLIDPFGDIEFGDEEDE